MGGNQEEARSWGVVHIFKYDLVNTFWDAYVNLYEWVWIGLSYLVHEQFAQADWREDIWREKDINFQNFINFFLCNQHIQDIYIHKII